MNAEERKLCRALQARSRAEVELDDVFYLRLGYCNDGRRILSPIQPFLDYAGVFVFALTGGLAAARDRHDFVTFWFFAVVTGIGGGTLRDLLIGVDVFWISDATYLGIGLIAALAVWLAAPHLERARKRCSGSMRLGLRPIL